MSPTEVGPVRAARLTPSSFARYATKGWFQLPKHLKLLERVLVEVAAGRKKRVALSFPPRHGKSELASKFFPAWFLGTFPDKRIILASYESDFAAQWGRAVRDLLTEHGPLVFGVRVRQDSSAANRWDIEGRRGGMQTAGAGGPIMGKGADLLIIDDPHKSWAEVSSEPIREGVWDWYQSTARSRLEPKGAVVEIQQRWHESDLMGHLLELKKKGLEDWEHLDFPAFAEEGDVLGRKKGEALWPDRFDEEALEAHRITIHPKFWEAQFQQHPSPLEGGLFKREHVQRYRIEGDEIVFGGEFASFDDLSRFATVDTATSTRTSADYTAIAVWGLTPRGKLVLLDLDMRRIEGVEILNAIKAACAKWRCVPWIEENSTSKHLLSFLSAEGFLFNVVQPGSQDKWTRAALHAAVMWSRGHVVIPESTFGWTHGVGGDFLPAFERQVFRFDRDSGDDDSVDCLSYACRIVVEEFGAGVGILAIPDAKPRDLVLPGTTTSPPPGFYGS